MSNTAPPQAQGRTLRYSPHPHKGTPEHPGGQVDLIWKVIKNSVTVACLGRRWGKTLGAMFLLLEYAARNKGPFRAAYCTPTARFARERFQQLALFLKQAGWRVKTNAQDLILEADGWGACTTFTVYFWGLDEPDNLRGQGLHLLIVDECKDVMSRAYYSVLRPMLADYGGHTLLIGTPSRIGVGAHWFREEFLKAQAGYPGYAYLHGPSEGNPKIDRAWLAEERRTKDPKTIQEEFDALWLEDEGSVFERIRETFDVAARQEGVNLWLPAEPDPVPWGKNEVVYVGWDVGRKNDATVIKAFRHKTRRELALVRLIRTPFHEQRAWLDRTLKMWPWARTVAVSDENGLGMQMAEELAREYGKGFIARSWANRNNKEHDVSAARSLSQQALWHHLNVPWQRAEYEAYRIVTHNQQNQALLQPRYEGPPGMHDDAVAAGCMIAPHLLRPFLDTAPVQEVEQFSTAWHEKRLDSLSTDEGNGTYTLS